MNADLFQPHVGPNTAPKHHPTTMNGNGAANAHLEQSARQETLHSNPVMNLDNILMELEHGGKDLLKIAHHAPKCGQDLRTEIRSLHAAKQQGKQLLLSLKKAPRLCSSKQSLLSEIRATKTRRVLRHHHPASNTKSLQALFQDIRSWHVKVLLKNTVTSTNKQALLSEIRWAGRTRPRQAVWRDVVRFVAASTATAANKLHPVQTTCRTMVWQDVRAMHGHAYKHLPPKQKVGSWMMDIHNNLSNNNKAAHLVNTKTMNRQSMMSEIRSSGSSMTSLKHVSTKSTTLLLSQIRRLVAVCGSTTMKLHHYPMTTVDRHALMTDIRAMRGHAYKHLPPKQDGWMMDIHNIARFKTLRHSTRTIDKQSQIRAAGFHHHDWKHDGVVTPKSISKLLSEVRLAHGHSKKEHVGTMNRRALMSDIRMMHGIAPKHLPFKQAHVGEWMMEIHVLPPRQLRHHANKTVNKQSLLTEIRSIHPEMQSVMVKSIQMLLSELRATHGNVIKPKTLHGTMNRRVLLSDVRACHGHARIHLPKNKDSWMMGIHSPRPLHHVEMMNKQALFTEIRTTASRAGRLFHHIKPKSIQMVLSQARMMHSGHKMKHHGTMNRSALMSDIRACHGTARKHLPKDSWMIEIQRPHSDLHHAKTMNKQLLLSEIRTTHPRMHHVVLPPKSNHDLMMQLRSMHGAKHGPMHLRPCEPVDRQGLMTDIRATHGHTITEVSC